MNSRSRPMIPLNEMWRWVKIKSILATMTINKVELPSENAPGAGSRSRFLTRPEHIALVLRVGLGLVLFSGGLSKLSQLLDPSQQAAILETYWGSAGYVNSFFDEYLFGGALANLLTPWLFLTTLSAFEFVAGLTLIAGILVRPMALGWGFIFWSFVAALPVITVAGVAPDLETHRTPALLVLIRDIGLSGLFFALFIIGSGSFSLDRRWFGSAATRRTLDWNVPGLLLRLSLGFPLLVGGLFHGFGHIADWGMPALVLILVALPFLLNIGVRWAGVAAALIMAWFLFSSFDLDRSLIANMNAVKREYAFLAAAIILAFCGGGRLFSILSGREGWDRLVRPGRLTDDASSPPQLCRTGGPTVTGQAKWKTVVDVLSPQRQEAHWPSLEKSTASDSPRTLTNG